MTVKEVLAERLRALRTKAKMTQKQVAQILNLDRSTYAYYETATTLPDYATLVRIAKMYRVTTDYLFGLEDSSEARGEVRPSLKTESLVSADSGDLLTAATPEEKQCLFTFRILAPEEQASLLAVARSILDGGGRTEK